jgi:hypothetical protein
MTFNSGKEINTHHAAYDAMIDAALHFYGTASPAPGLESRVQARLAAAPRTELRSSFMLVSGSQGWLLRLRGISLGAMTAAAACAIVVGSVHHSQRPAAIPQAAVGSHSGGVSAAGAPHTPTGIVRQTPTLDPQAPRSAPRSRSTVEHGGSSNAGRAVPRSPYPEPAASSEPQH